MKKKILLTGGNGFIGKNILESFLAEKYEITAPRSFELNIADTASVDAYFKNRSFDAVLHTATKPGHRNAKDHEKLFFTNVRMFENLERNKESFGKLINFGSGAVYDLSGNITDAKETALFKKMGADDHGFCKYVVAKQIEKLDSFTDINIFGIFGKYEDYTIRFISNAICKSLYGLAVTLRQNRRFSYIYAPDIMPILEFLIENKPAYKSYNIVPDEKCELLGLAKLAQKAAGTDTGIKVAQDGFGLDYTGSNERLKKEFPEVKFTKIETAVNQLTDYYRKNLSLIDKNLLLADK